jgi:ADP-ribose pyrophosphatase
MKDRPELLFEGEHLALLRSEGWEYAEHRKAREAVMVVALTRESEIVLADEYRPAVAARVLSLPAGLVGDSGEQEEPRVAAARELREETGYEAPSLERLGQGPGSAGASSELVTFFLARDARRVGDPSPEGQQLIRVHLVALDGLLWWARDREAEGMLVDPKIWAGLYLAATAGVAAALPDSASAPSEA